VSLTPREFDLLEVMLRHPRQVLSREQLCQQVWGYAFEGESNFIDVAIKELRKKLEVNGLPRLIQTVRGYGYALREE
jgi:DNA-binding response OmpR family regulator